jgi:hypothetical protein
MTEDTETAGSYRLSAARLRVTAATDANLERRDLLHTVADDYERLAQDLEAIDQLNRSIPKAIPRIRVSN